MHKPSESQADMLKMFVLFCLLLWKVSRDWFVFRQVDVPAVCADKVLKAALKHIEIIAKAREKGMNLYQLTESLCIIFKCQLFISIIHTFIYIDFEMRNVTCWHKQHCWYELFVKD